MLPVTVDGVRLFLHVLAATLWVGGQLTLVKVEVRIGGKLTLRVDGKGIFLEENAYIHTELTLLSGNPVSFRQASRPR